jgi:HK97 gp10 family phage protein
VSFEAEMRGLSEVLRTLKRLPTELASKGGGPVRSALFKAAKVIRDAAIQKAPLRTGALRKAIYVYRDRSPESDGLGERYIIGVRKVRLSKKERKQLREMLGAARAQGVELKVIAVEGDPYYWRFIEFGTATLKAEPFLRPALDENAAAAINVFRVEFMRKVANAVKRARGG